METKSYFVSYFIKNRKQSGVIWGARKYARYITVHEEIICCEYFSYGAKQCLLTNTWVVTNLHQQNIFLVFHLAWKTCIFFSELSVLTLRIISSLCKVAAEHSGRAFSAPKVRRTQPKNEKEIF